MRKYSLNLTTFSKYLFSYVVILLIPLLAMSVFSYNYFIRVFKDEVVNGNLGMITQVKNSIDQQLIGLKKIPGQIYNNYNLLPSTLGRSNYHSIQAVEDLKKYNTGNYLVNELFFYVRGEDILYSSVSTYSLPIFINAIYAYKDWNYNEFYEDINVLKKPVFRPGENVLVNKNTSARFVTYMYPVPVNSDNPYGTVIFLINEERIKSVISNVLKDNETNVFIVDEKNNLITSLTEHEHLNIGEFLDNTGSKTVKVNGVEYFISSVKSKDTGWIYAAFEPSDKALKKVFDMRMKIFYGIAAIVLIGSAVIYFLVHMNYYPIKKLKSFTEQKTGNPLDTCNEIEGVRLAINHITAASKTLQQKVDNNREAVKEYLLQNLLKGTFKDLPAFYEKARDIGIMFTKPYHRAAVIYLQNPMGIDKHLFIRELEGLFPGTIDAYSKDHMDDSKIVFILSMDTMSNSDLASHFSHMFKEMKEKWKLDITLGIGNRYQDIFLIGKSYIEASTSIDYKFIKGHNNIIFFDEISFEASNIECYPRKELNELELSVVRGDIDGIAQTIENLIGIIKENNVTLFIARCLCFDIINTIIKTMYEINKEDTFLAKDYPDAIGLSEFETVEELAHILQKICFDMCEYIQENNMNHSRDLLNEIIVHIQTHCMDCNFSIQSMAENFHMSLSNISHYFKDRTGKTISDYINYFRIEKSKEILKNSDQTLDNIIASIGYYNVSSFIRKFKQQVGTTPGKYRKLYSNEPSSE